MDEITKDMQPETSNEMSQNEVVAEKPPVFDVTKLDKKSLEILEETEDDEYRFTLSQFEGPLDLLLHLIKSTKIDIFEISLSAITEQYLEYMKEYLDRYMSRDLFQSATLTRTVDMTPEEKKKFEEDQRIEEKRRNPYGFNFGQVSEEDIIRGAIESGVAVFLHGQSSEGKSARVKQIDPECVIIYLRNATPESLNGKSV